MQLQACIFCACRARALFRGKASHAAWWRKSLASKAFLLTPGVGIHDFEQLIFCIKKRRGKKREHQSAPLRWRRRRDYLRAVPLMASSAGKGSVPFLHHASPPPRTHSCEFTISSGSSSAPAQKKGAPKCSLALAQKTRFELVLPVKVLLP